MACLAVKTTHHSWAGGESDTREIYSTEEGVTVMLTDTDQAAYLPDTRSSRGHRLPPHECGPAAATGPRRQCPLPPLGPRRSVVAVMEMDGGTALPLRCYG